MHKLSTERGSKYGIRLGWISIIGNVILFVLKYIAGILSGSVALIADAWHTLTDSLSSIILIIGIRVARKPPDEEHPFGHGRAEWISSLLIGVFMLAVGLSFMQESIGRLKNHQDFEYGLMAWIATIVSILVKEGMAQLSFRGARVSGLLSLKADGWHHRTDSLSSVLILLGLIFADKFWWIDGVLGIAVSLFIFAAAYGILKENISHMIGRRPDKETIDKIYKIVRDNCKKEVNIHDIRIHYYGQYIEMTAHIKLPGHLSLDSAHAIANQIEEMILKDMNIHATIHTEPQEG
ncbi:MAG: cation diffusion facilitator family transporter [Bacteroidota bacterium]|nr:cation diffusion facilitator family transporter [Bacteroidota bacterium]